LGKTSDVLRVFLYRGLTPLLRSVHPKLHTVTRSLDIFPKETQNDPTKPSPTTDRTKHNLSEYNHPDYKEARVRAEFIAPLLEVLGWDARSEIVAGACGWGGMVGLRRAVA